MLGLLTLAKTRPRCCVAVYFWSYEIAVMADQSTYLVWQKWGWISKWYSPFQQIKTAGFMQCSTQESHQKATYFCVTPITVQSCQCRLGETCSLNHTGRQFDLWDDHGAEELLPVNLGSKSQLVLGVLSRLQPGTIKSSRLYIRAQTDKASHVPCYCKAA